jgi:hypothetical protein
MNKISTANHKGKKHFISAKSSTGKSHFHYNTMLKVWSLLSKEARKIP